MTNMTDMTDIRDMTGMTGMTDQSTATSRRWVALDFLRGVMLLMMMVDHAFFMGFTQWTVAKEWLYGFFGYVTAAEGFYFLSGLVCALVFYRGFLPGAVVPTARLWRRVRTIWCWHLVTVVAAYLCVILYATDRDATLVANPYLSRFLEHPLGVLMLAPIFLARPPFLDILPLYVHYLAAAPLLLRWFATGRAWLVWLVTGLLWGVGQFGAWNALFESLRKTWPDLPVDGGYFDPCSWLLPFVLGLTVGCHWQSRGLTTIRAYGAVLFPASVLACVFFWAHRHGLIVGVPPFFPPLIDIGRLGPIRVVNLLGAITVLGFLIAWFPRVFVWGPIAFLGRHSLHVFVYQVVLLFAAIPVWVWTQDLPPGDPRGLALLGVTLLSLWIPAWLHHRMGQ